MNNLTHQTGEKTYRDCYYTFLTVDRTYSQGVIVSFELFPP